MLNAVKNVQLDSFNPSSMANPHQWVTVFNPIDRRELLQACDNCGVVKSQNTLHKHCAADSRQRLISGSLRLVKG